jgi:hypothetical protein
MILFFSWFLYYANVIFAVYNLGMFFVHFHALFCLATVVHALLAFYLRGVALEREEALRDAKND